MSSGSSNKPTQIYGKGIVDNGAKWGSYVKREADGSFPFDAQMNEERPDDWYKMIRERVSYMDAPNRPYKTPRKWAVGRTKPFK
jgi:hypothetical protein